MRIITAGQGRTGTPFHRAALRVCCVLAALLLVGFALAPIYPCLMHEATRRGFNDATAAALTGLQPF